MPPDQSNKTQRPDEADGSLQSSASGVHKASETSIFKGALSIRIASAAVLGPWALGATYVGGAAFAATITFMTIIMVFEWARMVERNDYAPVFLVLALSGAGALIMASGGFYAIAFALTGGGGLAAFVTASRFGGRPSWAGFAALYILAPCVALIWLREAVDHGRALTFALFAIVWAADSGAYFAGRFIGGPRISRALSPEKTWTGVIGGVVAGGLAGGAAVKAIYGEGSLLAFAAMGASLGLCSVLGDLAESAFKRIFGVKDSSQFIPGHGGFLDRLDGMIFATTAMTCVLFAHMSVSP